MHLPQYEIFYRQVALTPSIEEAIGSLKRIKINGTESSIGRSEVMIAAKNLKKLCISKQPELLKEFISQVRKVCPDIEKKIPNFAKALNALDHIPLARLSNPKEVLTFVDALIESGLADQSDQGLIFVLGNTNSGKTSLVNTFKDFVEHPSEKPRSVLTTPDDNLIETQVLEVYDGLSLKQENAFKVELAGTSPVLVNLKEVKKTVTKTEFLKGRFHKLTNLLAGSVDGCVEGSAECSPEVMKNNSNTGLQLKIVDLGIGNYKKKHC